MRVFFYTGWAFLALAFAVAAAEAIPSALPGDRGVFISAYDLWYAAAPGSLIVTQIQVERISPALWDPLIVTVLTLPGWLLCLIPGGLLIWFCRPHKEMSEELREEMKTREEAFLLLDQLARDAEEAGFNNDEDDRRPDHSGHDLIDSEGGMDPFAEETFPGTDAPDNGKNRD